MRSAWLQRIRPTSTRRMAPSGISWICRTALPGQSARPARNRPRSSVDVGRSQSLRRRHASTPPSAAAPSRPSPGAIWLGASAPRAARRRSGWHGLQDPYDRPRCAAAPLRCRPTETRRAAQRRSPRSCGRTIEFISLMNAGNPHLCIPPVAATIALAGGVLEPCRKNHAWLIRPPPDAKSLAMPRFDTDTHRKG